MHPIIMLHYPEIVEGVKMATEAGMDGIDFFIFKKGIQGEYQKVKEVIL